MNSVHAARLPSDRSFGLSVGGAFEVFGALSWWRGFSSAATVLLVVGAVLMGSALVAPAVLRGANRLWWRFAQILGWFNARVLLTVFFFVVLTPMGLIMRLLGRNPLRPDRSDTNWSASTPRPRRPPGRCSLRIRYHGSHDRHADAATGLLAVLEGLDRGVGDGDGPTLRGEHHLVLALRVQGAFRLFLDGADSAADVLRFVAADCPRSRDTHQHEQQREREDLSDGFS